MWIKSNCFSKQMNFGWRKKIVQVWHQLRVDLILRKGDEQSENVIRNEVIAHQDCDLLNGADQADLHAKRSQGGQLLPTNFANISVVMDQRVMQFNGLFVHDGRGMHRYGQDDATVVDQNGKWDVLKEGEKRVESNRSEGARDY